MAYPVSGMKDYDAPEEQPPDASNQQRRPPKSAFSRRLRVAKRRVVRYRPVPPWSEAGRERFRRWPGFTVLRIADFRLLWIGSLLSFTGTQVQNVAQGALVFEITGSEFKLSLVNFCAMFPITLIGPMAAVFTDIWDKRRTMVVVSLIFSASTMFLAIASFFGFIQYWHILMVATINGITATIENPTRQSVVRTVVPKENLASAIPAQGMTFNLARVVGPAVGGVLTQLVGPFLCFMINSFSYLMVLRAALKIKTDLSASPREPQPVKDLIFEGMLFTFRDKSLRTLFTMESFTSMFGMFYLFLMPAIADRLLGLPESGLGACYSAVGIGALTGLVLATSISHKKIKPLLIRSAMTLFVFAMLTLSLTHWLPLAFLAMACLGGCAIMQFNTTNTLFQLIAPARLRGRVLAMHFWSVGGLSPIGALAAGTVAELYGLRVALAIGSGLVAIGAVYGWMNRDKVVEPDLNLVD